MNKQIFLFILLLTGIFAKAQNNTLNLTLKQAESRFTEHNLILLIEKYNVDIAQAEVIQARLFENPVISIDHNVYNKNSKKYFDFGQEGQTEVEIEQLIYLAGQRNKRVRVEKLNKEIAVYQFEEVLRTLKSELNSRFIELYFARKGEDIYQKEIESIEKLLEVYTQQAEKGNISILEKSRLQALLLNLKQEQNELNDQIITLQSELALLINIPAGQTIHPVFEDTLLSKLNMDNLSYADLTARLWERPDLKITRTSIKASQANIKLQKSEAFPEFSIRGTYDKAGGIYEDYFSVGVSLSIPIFNRNQGNIKAAKTSLIQNQIVEEYTRQQAEHELYNSYARLEKSLSLYKFANTGLDKDFETIIDGVNSNFRKRNISLLEFIDYYEAYKETSLQLYETKKNVFLSLEELNMITGSIVFQY